MGGGARYPYPKEVWSPAGGWWTRPANWRMNTAICAGAIVFITYNVWTLSAAREFRHSEPKKPLISRMFSSQPAQHSSESSS